MDAFRKFTLVECVPKVVSCCVTVLHESVPVVSQALCMRLLVGCLGVRTLFLHQWEHLIYVVFECVRHL